jgi:hypothetical protein
VSFLPLGSILQLRSVDQSKERTLRQKNKIVYFCRLSSETQTKDVSTARRSQCSQSILIKPNVEKGVVQTFQFLGAKNVSNEYAQLFASYFFLVLKVFGRKQLQLIEQWFPLIPT